MHIRVSALRSEHGVRKQRIRNIRGASHSRHSAVSHDFLRYTAFGRTARAVGQIRFPFVLYGAERADVRLVAVVYVGVCDTANARCVSRGRKNVACVRRGRRDCGVRCVCDSGMGVSVQGERAQRVAVGGAAPVYFGKRRALHNGVVRRCGRSGKRDIARACRGAVRRGRGCRGAADAIAVLDGG